VHDQARAYARIGLRVNVIEGRPPTCGYGLIDAEAAVSAAAS
jgi:hypothetical protein